MFELKLGKRKISKKSIFWDHRLHKFTHLIETIKLIYILIQTKVSVLLKTAIKVRLRISDDTINYFSKFIFITSFKEHYDV